ncbi:MAG: CPBP family intramembrane metalloprotease [Bacteroidia bacterium]|nr:CPBP family intramembrane metalloprotease [Bacteroidia bacterium]
METETSNQNIEIPFQNLFLTKGFVTGKNEPWRYVLGIIIAAVGYFVFQSIIMFPLINAALENGVLMNEILQNPNIIFSPEKTGINKSVLLAIMMGMFVFTLLFFWLAIKFIQQKPLNSVITGYDRIRWNRYFFAFSVWGLLLIGLTVVSYLISPQDMVLQFNPSAFIVLVLVSVIFIPIQTATEEILFRGYLMQGLGIGLKNGIFPLIITSILFGLMHGTNPEAQAHGFLIMMPYYILFGAFLGMLTLLDEGAELAMGIHCANNLLSSLLVCSKNSVLQTDAIFYTSVENPSGEFLIWIIMALVCFIILRKKYQLNNWSLILR